MDMKHLGLWNSVKHDFRVFYIGAKITQLYNNLYLILVDVIGHSETTACLHLY